MIVSSLSKWISARSPGRFGRSLTSPAVRANLIFGLIALAAVLISIASAPGMVGLWGASLALVMLTIAIIDGRSFVIPDWLNAAGIALAMLHAVAQTPDAMLNALMLAVLRGATAALVFLALRSFYMLIRGRQGIGLGDVKLAGVAGAWLDWSMLPIAVQLGAIAALSVYVLRQMTLGRSIAATSRIPFGLFFAPAIWICWLLQTRWLVLS